MAYAFAMLSRLQLGILQGKLPVHISRCSINILQESRVARPLFLLLYLDGKNKASRPNIKQEIKAVWLRETNTAIPTLLNKRYNNLPHLVMVCSYLNNLVLALHLSSRAPWLHLTTRTPDSI